MKKSDLEVGTEYAVERLSGASRAMRRGRVPDREDVFRAKLVALNASGQYVERDGKAEYVAHDSTGSTHRLRLVKPERRRLGYRTMADRENDQRPAYMHKFISAPSREILMPWAEFEARLVEQTKNDEARDRIRDAEIRATAKRAKEIEEALTTLGLSAGTTRYYDDGGDYVIVASHERVEFSFDGAEKLVAKIGALV